MLGVRFPPAHPERFLHSLFSSSPPHSGPVIAAGVRLHTVIKAQPDEFPMNLDRSRTILRILVRRGKETSLIRARASIHGLREGPTSEATRVADVYCED